jgi:hypothetical protein
MREYSMPIRTTRVVLTALVLGLAAVRAGAQAPARTGVVEGLVLDALGKPIVSVEVTAMKTGVSVRTDTSGHFSLPPLASGSADISFRRLAFAPVILMMQVPAGDTTDVEVTLSVVAQELKAVVVQADAAQLRQLEAFESRRRQGIGHFITRYQIEQRQPHTLADMLRMVPGAIVVNGDNGRTGLRFNRVARNCPPQFFVDGIQTSNFSLDEMPPSDVEGIEIYAGPAGLPPEYNRLYGTSSCGSVIIWTRIPGTQKAKP